MTLAAVTYTKPPVMSGYVLKIPDGNDETRFSDKSRIERPSKNRAPGNIIVAFTSVVMLLRLKDIAKISTGNALMSGRAVSSLSSSAMPVGALLKSEWGMRRIKRLLTHQWSPYKKRTCECTAKV